MQKTQLTDRQRFLRFAVVGVSGTVVDFSIFFLLSRIFGFPKNESYSISFILAVVNNFIWNRNWTYPESKEKNFAEQLYKFFIVSAVGYFIRKIAFPFLNKPFIDFSKLFFSQQFIIKPEAIGDFLALGSVIIIVLFWNYFINRIWTYKDIK
jgi:putative flippase GtrA